MFSPFATAANARSNNYIDDAGAAALAPALAGCKVLKTLDLRCVPCPTLWGMPERAAPTETHQRELLLRLLAHKPLPTEMYGVGGPLSYQLILFSTLKPLFTPCITLPSSQSFHPMPTHLAPLFSSTP